MGRYNSQTEDLAKLFCQANLELSNPWHFGMEHTLSEHTTMKPFSQIEGFLNQARKLLETGADPTVCVNTFQYEGRKFHQIWDGDSDPEADFFEGYISCFRSSAHLEQCYSVMRTPLVDAVYTKDMTTVELLIQYGTKIRSFNHWLRNPYMPAVATNNHILLDMLLQATECSATTITYWMKECMTRALEIAARPGSDFKVVLALMKKGAENPLSFLPEYVSDVIIDHAIQHDIALPQIQKEKPEILAAAFLDHVDLCRLIVQKGADVKACDTEGFSALHVAVGNKTVDVCAYLIRSGADVFARDSHNMTPLLEATYYGHTDAIRLLLAHGSSPDTIIRVNSEPSHQDNRDQTCSRLQGHWRKGRDVAAEWFEVQQWSAVHIAAFRGLTSILQMLVEQGADLTVKDDLGCTALDIAINHSNSTTAFWLLAQGCPFQAKTEAASRLLVQAMEECNSTVVRKLLEHGVYFPDGDESREGFFGDLNWNMNVMPRATNNWASLLSSSEPFAPKGITSSICGSCSLALKVAKIDLSTTNSEPDCHLCRLIHDCASIAYTNTMVIKYINDTGVPDRELLMETGDNRFLHSTLR